MRAVTRRRRAARGQSLAELALLLPFLAGLVAAIAQFGFLFFGTVNLDTAAREGARVASVQPQKSGAFNNGGAPTAATCTFNGTNNYASGGATPNPACSAIWGNRGALSTFRARVAGVSYGSGGPCALGDGYVEVTVTYDAPVFVPFMGTILGASGNVKTLNETVFMRLEPCGIIGNN